MKDKQKFLAYFRKAQVRFSGIYAKILSQAGLTLPQYALLSQLGVTGPATMTEISTALHISKPAVTNLVDRLEEKKFLRRTAHPHDRRITLLEIRPQAHKTVQRIQAHVLQFLLTALDRFAPREREVIAQFYEAIAQTLDQYSAREKKS